MFYIIVKGVRMLNSISFTGKYLQTKTIKRKTPEKIFQDCKAKFVELDSDCPNDIDTLSSVNYSWDNGRTFLADINEEFRDCREFENPSSFKRFFAITTQKSDVENLKPKKVLGVAEVFLGNTENVVLKYLQVDPKNNMQCKESGLKGIGTAIIDGIKEVFRDKDIIVQPVKNKQVKKFYRANGFQPHTNDLMIYKHSD